MYPGCTRGTNPERTPQGVSRLPAEASAKEGMGPSLYARPCSSRIPQIAPFLCSPRNSYTRKDFKSFRFSTYKHFLMLLKTNDFKPFRISRSTIFARNPFRFSTYIKTWGEGEECLPSYPHARTYPRSQDSRECLVSGIIVNCALRGEDYREARCAPVTGPAAREVSGRNSDGVRSWKC